MTHHSGRVAAHASLSPRQAKAMGLMTSGTYGPLGSGSSSSAALNASLVSRLRARTQTLGSPLYKLTWKDWDIPSGPSRSRQRASALRTSASDFTGWPTPVARDHFPAHTEAYIAAKMAQGHGMANLNDRVQLAAWPTPTLSNTRTGNPEAATAMTRPDGTKVQQRLQDFAAIVGPARITVSGTLLTGSTVGMVAGGQLNPEHSRWLMGLPAAWSQSMPGYESWQAWQTLTQLVSEMQSPTE